MSIKLNQKIERNKKRYKERQRNIIKINGTKVFLKKKRRNEETEK